MGPELCERPPDRLGGAAITDSNAKRTGVLEDRSRLPFTGSGEPCAEGGDIRDISADQRDVKRERLCLLAVCSPKEGRRHQTSCEPKGSQFVCQAGIFQNGRNTSAEKSPLPRRLDDESRSERCVLRHCPQLPGQEIPEIPMAREPVPVQLPTIRTVVGSVDLYQGQKASGEYSQNPGHENYHLHRRHPGHGTKQRDCSAAHRLSDFPARELGVHHHSAETLTDPSQEIEFLDLIADSIQMDVQLPGSKIKNIRSDAKTLLQASQPTAQEVSRLLVGMLTHATHAVRAALLQASSVMPSCCPATDAGLHSTLPSDRRGKRRTVMVGHSPNVLEWEIHPSRQSGSYNRDGRLPDWLGEPVAETSRRADHGPPKKQQCISTAWSFWQQLWQFKPLPRGRRMSSFTWRWTARLPWPTSTRWVVWSHHTSIGSPKNFGLGALPRMSPFELLTSPKFSTRKRTRNQGSWKIDLIGSFARKPSGAFKHSLVP